MDNSPRNGDQSRKEIAIAHAASSMINASDMLTSEAYHANQQRIQQVKEMIQKLEQNNEAAHKNFLVGQLEKRAKDGREAEDMLAHLRSQPALSETVQFTNNVPNRSEVILPTTATLVEVSEPHPSVSFPSPSPATTSQLPRNVQYSRPVNHLQTVPTQVQPYYPDNFRYYNLPPSIPQRNVAPHSQTPVDPGKRGRHTQPSQPRTHNPPAPAAYQPIVDQQFLQSWSSYSPQVALPATNVVPGYYPSPAGWTNTPLAHGGPTVVPSNPTFREPSISGQSTTSWPPANDQSTFRMQMPVQAVPTMQAYPSTGSYPMPTESQPRPVSTTVSKPATISELQRSRKPLQPPQQQLKLPDQQLQPQQQPQPQKFQQTSLQHIQDQLSKRTPQLSQVPQQAPLPTDHAMPTSASQPRRQPSPSQSTGVQDQAQHMQKPPFDQATFVKLFQSVVQRGAVQLKTFLFQAKASGVIDEWFKIAIESLPPDVWRAALAQAGPLVANAPTRQVSTVTGPNTPVVSAPLPPATIPHVPVAPTPQPSMKSAERNVTGPVLMQRSHPYATQLRYYAEHATQSVNSAQMPKSPQGNIAPTATMLMTPRWDAQQAPVHARSSRDANKATLARDILYAFGKTVQNLNQDTGGQQADETNNHESGQLPEVAPIQPVPHPDLTKAPETDLINANLPLNEEDEPQRAASPYQSTAKSVLKEEHGQAAIIQGPIMIDLTLEDSDESIDGKGQEPTFQIRPSSAAAKSPSRPTSPTNATNPTPLIENLSLGKSPIDVVEDDNNTDVHMHSPRLALVVEEDMQPGLLYPPSNSAEVVLPNTEPCEANEHPVDGQLPLFLPSPPVSPALTEPPATEPETNDEVESRSSLRRRTVDIDEMEIDTEVATLPRAKKRQKRQVYVFVPPAPSYVKRAKMKKCNTAMGVNLDLEGTGQGEEPQYNHLEQVLIEESRLRLLERRCQWLNCGVILNCAAKLFVHLKNHAREEGLQAPFFCRWASCQRRFDTEQERDGHLERHATIPLPCPFAGCDERFDRPVEVMQHEVQHQKAGHREALVHKPTCEPIVPAIPTRLGRPPIQLPAHRVMPRRIAKCQISADRHAVVGPWVLWSIFSPVELHMRRQNATMRGRPTRQAVNYDIDNSDVGRDDYDFLLAVSTYPAKDPQLDDLDSALITMSAARGLTLWGSGATVSGTGGSAPPEACRNGSADGVVATAPRSGADETGVVEGRSNENEGAVAGRGNSTAPEEGQSMVAGEEDTVERMLIV